MKKKNDWLKNPEGWMRKPGEPTAYELAVKQYGPASPELKAWARQHYLSKYVPEDVLLAMGLEQVWWRDGA